MNTTSIILSVIILIATCILRQYNLRLFNLRQKQREKETVNHKEGT